MATNRADTLDPALLRPGRLDRKIEFPMPDRRQKRLIFSTITAKMNLSDEVDIEDFVARPDKISGADINSICQEVWGLLHQNVQLACLNGSASFFRLVCRPSGRIAMLCWPKILRSPTKLLLKKTSRSSSSTSDILQFTTLFFLLRDYRQSFL